VPVFIRLLEFNAVVRLSSLSKFEVERGEKDRMRRERLMRYEWQFQRKAILEFAHVKRRRIRTQ
jgi:hypothetical protein